MAVIVYETQLPELVHEKADTWPRRPDDFRQCLLADLHGDRLGAAFLAEIRQQEQRARQALLARVEEMVGEVLLGAAGARQQMGDEPFTEGRLIEARPSREPGRE